LTEQQRPQKKKATLIRRPSNSEQWEQQGARSEGMLGAAFVVTVGNFPRRAEQIYEDCFA